MKTLRVSVTFNEEIEAKMLRYFNISEDEKDTDSILRARMSDALMEMMTFEEVVAVDNTTKVLPEGEDTSGEAILDDIHVPEW